MRIWVDMDGILADFTARMFQRLEDLYGRVCDAEGLLTGHDISAHPALEGLPRNEVYAPMHEPGFFASLDPMPGAVAAMRWMHQRHEVSILTAAPDARAQRNKLEWVERYLPFFPRERVKFCAAREKYEYVADVIIEDRPDTLVQCAAAQPAALVTGIEWPYNRHLSAQLPLSKDYSRSEVAWSEIRARIFLRGKEMGTSW